MTCGLPSQLLAMRLRRLAVAAMQPSPSSITIPVASAAMAQSVRTFSSATPLSNPHVLNAPQTGAVSSGSRFVLWKPVSRPRLSMLRAPGVAPVSAPFTSSNALWYSLRCMTARGKDRSHNRPASDEDPQSKSGDEERKTRDEASAAEEEEGSGGGGAAKPRQTRKTRSKAKSFADHVRGIREDYSKFPDMYNSANLINFIIFTVFCLCSTGSNTEEAWWLSQWGVDSSFKPHTWLLHSFLTNSFTAMAYAMMLLHTMCHALLPVMGSRTLLLYVASTATISGAIIFGGNRLYYGSQPAPEKQFGPWDVVHALFVMQYYCFGTNPVTTLNSFSGWVKYAMWVGEVCILYFDWQPTVVGTFVGLALLKGVPRFRVGMPAAM